jgi:hypothetical protein
MTQNLKTTHHLRLPSGIVIQGRLNHDLHCEVRKAKEKLHGELDHNAGYLLDNEYVNAVFRHRENGMHYVCRSIHKQFYCTSMALVGIFCQQSGSSFSHVIQSLVPGAILEGDHAKCFWDEHELLWKATEPRCIYCGGAVDPTDNKFYACGLIRHYNRWGCEEAMTRNISENHPSDVHAWCVGLDWMDVVAPRKTLA